MNKITKKIVAITIGLSMMVTLLGPVTMAEATTITELEALIARLTQELDGARRQLNELQGQDADAPAADVPAACEDITFNRNLRLGMTGNDVKCLQALLNASADTRIAATGPGSPGNETTRFGPRTRAAVIKFQRENVPGTTGTGFVGPLTRVKLNALLEAGVVADPDPDPEVGPGLSVRLAADTPAPATLVSSAAGVGADQHGSQALAPIARFIFSNGTTAAVRVTTLRLTRTGIAADADLANVYLFDGATRLAEMPSVANRVYSFVNAAGLFSIPANSTKSILVKADLANVSLAGRTIALGINAATDIVAEGVTFTGAFPMNGNMMSMAAVADIGRLTVGPAAPTAPASVDPGITAREILRFNMVAANQNLNVSSIRFTNVGTIANTDLANLRLMDGATQLGSTLPNLAADNTAVFDLSVAPLAITSGTTRSLTILADVVGGTGRNFRLTIQRQSDIVVRDTSYGINVRPYTDPTLETFGIVQPTAPTTVNTGTLAVAIDAVSPTGNVALHSTNVELARFRFVASGEAVRVLTLPVQLTIGGTTPATTLRNVRLMLDGVQVGATDPSMTSGTAETFPAGDFGNSFIIPAGTTGRVLSIMADIREVSGTTPALADGHTITAQINAGTAQGMTSLTSITTGATVGRLLTVATGALTVARNLAVPHGTITLPTAVIGATGVRIGSFVLTAGAGEGVSVSQIQLTDGMEAVDGHTLADAFQNLRLMRGTTQIGTTVTSLIDTEATVYTFTPAVAISIPAGQQVVFDVLADIRSTVPAPVVSAINADTTGIINHTLTTATGLVTTAVANATAVQTLQNVFIAGAGVLTVIASPDTAVSQQLVMGATGQELARFRFTETSGGEDVNITRIVVQNTVTPIDTHGTIQNIQLLDGTTVLGTVVSLAHTGTGTGTATFSGLNVTVPRGGNRTLTVRADITPFPGGTSNSTHVLNVIAGTVATGASSGSSLTVGASTGVAGTMRAFRTRLSVARDVASPAGLSARTAELTAAIFRISNTSNVGAFDATLRDLAITVATSGTWTTTGERLIRVYRDSITSANLLATRTTAIGAALPTSIAFGTWTTPVDLTDVAISSGGSVNLIVTVNTAEAPTAGTLTIGIAAGGVRWTDVGAGAPNIDLVDTLPVTGNTLSF